MEALFVHDDVGGHRLFVVHAPEPGDISGIVVHAPSLGEEMNLSRRCVAAAARAMAGAGFAVLLADPFGCGDSSGEPGAFTWTDWDADLDRSVRYMKGRWPGLPVWLWAHRAGALVLPSAMGGDNVPAGVLLWQPMVEGAELLKHWQRLAAAAAISGGHSGGAAIEHQSQTWSSGGLVDAGGLSINANMARSTGSRRLLPPRHGANGRVVWLDVHSRARTEPSTSARTWLDRWEAAGWTTRWRSTVGPPFWLGPEVTVNDDLVTATVDAIRCKTTLW